jgi:hypothetical protein
MVFIGNEPGVFKLDLTDVGLYIAYRGYRCQSYYLSSVDRISTDGKE